MGGKNFGLIGGLEFCFFADHFDEFNHAVAKAPFVIIPCEDFNEVALFT
jgi:hypothetical protein